MNAPDMLQYGNRTLMSAVEGLSEESCAVEGVLGWWSVKDIMAHMASFEHLLADVLDTFLGAAPGAYMNDKTQPNVDFNEVQVDRRKNMTMAELVTEYEAAHRRVLALAAQIPAETYRENGSLPWYGSEYCLDDYIVYTNYAHKREHSAQIGVYRDQLKQ